MSTILLTRAGARVLDAGLSANDRFKLNYPRYLRWALLVALLLTALGVAVMPRYEPVPYKPRAEVLQLIEIAEPPVVIEEIKPREVTVPPKSIEVVEGDEPIENELPLLGWTTFFDPSPPAVEAPSDEGFVASSATPLLRLQPRADYPEIARRAGLEGTVVVQVLVGDDGLVHDAVVSRPVHPLLDRAAVAAARRCVFEPARQRTLKVKAWVEVPYRFRLR